LPNEIEALEREQQQLHAAMAAPDYHKGGAEPLKRDRARMDEIERMLEQKFERWSELEERAKAAKG
jgi:ATP-binding cassette subfamily F protein uup